jgi:TonB family protein
MQQTSASLRRELEDLKTTFSLLSDRLSRANEQFRKAAVALPEDLLADLSYYKRRLAAFGGKVLAYGKDLSLLIDLPVADLDDLDRSLHILAEVEEQHRKAVVKDNAIAVLDRVLQIARRDGAAFSPLLECQKKAQALRQAIARFPSPEPHPEAHQLAAGKHPFSLLLYLVDHQSDLTDNEGLCFHEIVAESFGKDVAIAAIRGKLQSAGKSENTASPEPGEGEIEEPQVVVESASQNRWEAGTLSRHLLAVQRKDRTIPRLGLGIAAMAAIVMVGIAFQGRLVDVFYPVQSAGFPMGFQPLKPPTPDPLQVLGDLADTVRQSRGWVPSMVTPDLLQTTGHIANSRVPVALKPTEESTPVLADRIRSDAPAPSPERPREPLREQPPAQPRAKPPSPAKIQTEVQPEVPEPPRMANGLAVTASATAVETALSDLLSPVSAVPPPAPPPRERIRVGGQVAAAKLVRIVNPTYPVAARRLRLQGSVELEAMINKEGAVENLSVISGNSLLTSAAIDAVRQWRYEPTLLNGMPVEVVTTVEVTFTLQP